MREVNTVSIGGVLPPYSTRKTDNPVLVKAVLAALEHGMVDDPAAEALRREQRPYNGMLHLEYRKAGEVGHNLRSIYFDADQFSPPRYRQEFVDAVKAAYRGGQDMITFQKAHPEPSLESGSGGG